MLNIETLNVYHKGFEIGYIKGRYGYKAAWRNPGTHKWQEGFIYVDTIQEIKQLAIECIDFHLLRISEEIKLGRKLTNDELFALKDKY